MCVTWSAVRRHLQYDVCHAQIPQGTSKAAVTAGLIGGRVGNKGGVGISLKLAGTTFLFLNAHLTGKGQPCPLGRKQLTLFVQLTKERFSTALRT